MSTITNTDILAEHARQAGDRAKHFTAKEIILQVRIALAFLGNQNDPTAPRYSAEKHDIERWAGRYVSEHAVRTAATLLGLSGAYPYYGKRGSIRFPNPDALSHIPEAYSQPNYCQSLSTREWYRRSDANHPNVLAVIARAAVGDQEKAQREWIKAVRA